MPLATTQRMLSAARAGQYAVGAFNAENLEMVQAIVGAAQELDSPVIVQTTPGTLKYASLDQYYRLVAVAAASASVPVAIHLDHGDSMALAMKALRTGYTSIMIDGSKEPLQENIALTRSVVAACEPVGVPVEGELGLVGGKEDDLESDEAGYADLEEVEQFLSETGVSSLALGIGTAHGIYPSAPVLNIELVRTVRARTTVPLVLHGTSGLSDDVVRECVSEGMAKVNFATELRQAYTEAVSEYLAANPSVFDPKRYGAAARDAVKAKVMHHMRVLGSVGKAAECA